MIMAVLVDAYVDADFDGDGRPERIFQLPDCLAVITQGADRWEIPVVVSRPVPRDMERVTLRAVRHNGVLTTEVRDSRDEPHTRDVYYFRWTGRALVPTP